MRLFVDLDGTLAEFRQVDTLETLYEKGYFLNLEPQYTVVDMVTELLTHHPDIEVYILSAVLTDSAYALEEKNAWIDTYLPEIDKTHRLFPPCGTDKKDYVPGGICETDYLLDDYTKNLCQWQQAAKGIKLLNGINHTKGTWKEDCVSFEGTGKEMAEKMVDIMKHGKRIKDRNPNIGERSEKQEKVRFCSVKRIR